MSRQVRSSRAGSNGNRRRYKINWKRMSIFLILVLLVIFLCVKCVSGCVSRDKSDPAADKVKDNIVDPSGIEFRSDEAPVGDDRSIRGIPELKDVLIYDD